MPSTRLTLERRRGSEAVLRDLEGRRWVAPSSALPLDTDTVEVSVQTVREPEGAKENTEPVAREFLTRILSGS